MKIETLKSALEGAATRVSKAIRNGGGASSCILAERDTEQGLRLTGTNGDVTISTVLKCEAEGFVPMAIPASLLNRLLAAMPEGTLTLGYDEAKRSVEIESAVGRTAISCSDHEQFPRSADDGCETKMTVANAAFREVLRKVQYAASTDDTRKVIRNILFVLGADGLTAVATNGRLLAKVEYEKAAENFSGKEVKILVPPTACALLADKSVLGTEADVTIEVPKTRKYAKFTCGDTTVRTVLFDDAYPNYSQVIPADGDNPVELDRRGLLEAIERASIFSPEGDGAYVSLTFYGDALCVESQASERGSYEETIPVRYKGDRMRILMAKRYIAPVLKAIDDDAIQLHLTGSVSPVLVKCSIPFVAVVMPVRDYTDNKRQ